jgi:VanZ family protein
VTSRRLPTVVFSLYVVFVVYGSLFPFHFISDPHALRHLLDHPVPRRISLPDVAANLLLGVPFGALMVWSGLAGAGPVARLASVVLADTVLASVVEVAQLFVPGRISSVLDVAAQVAGSLGGLLVMQGLLASSRRPLGPRLAAALHRRPMLVLLLTLAAVLAADAVYPFAISLDVSTVWHNLKAGQWRPLGSLTCGFWPDLLVEKLLVYAMVGVLARISLEGLGSGAAGPLAWAGVTTFAVALEGVKLLIVSRAPNVDTIWLGAAGALLGVTLLPALGRTTAVRRHAAALLVSGAVALLAYEELTPFIFVGSRSALLARLSRVEWVPFGAYYGADVQSALFDVGKKLVLGAAVGAAMRYASPRPRLVLVLLLGALLEAVQILQPVHIPATTDVLTLYLGALAGAHLLNRSLVSGGSVY